MKILQLLAILPALVLYSGCATMQNPMHRAAVANEQLAIALENVQTEVIRLYEDGKLPESEHRIWQRNIRDMAQLQLALNASIRAANAQGASAALTAFLDMLESMINEDIIRIPVEQRPIIIGSLETVRLILVSISTTI